MSFGERVQLLLKEKQMTQKELAEMVNTTEASISRYTNNARLPKGDIIVKIAQALDTTSDYLLSDDKSITLNLSTDSVGGKTEWKSKEESFKAGLREDEKYLLRNYNLLSDNMKNVLISMSDTLVGAQNEKES